MRQMFWKKCQDRLLNYKEFHSFDYKTSLSFQHQALRRLKLTRYLILTTLLSFTHLILLPSAWQLTGNRTNKNLSAGTLLRPLLRLQGPKSKPPS